MNISEKVTKVSGGSGLKMILIAVLISVIGFISYKIMMKSKKDMKKKLYIIIRDSKGIKTKYY